jgi:hypothetical protein
VLSAIFSLCTTLACCAVAFAEDVAESRATAFEAVQGPTTEQVPGGMLLVAAYAVVLVLLVGYVGRLGALQRKNSDELSRLTAAVERARKA